MVSKATYSVLGLGAWGTALSQHLASLGNSVLAWTIDQEVVDSINNNSINLKYLSNVKLSENLKATSKLEDLVDSEYLLSVLPAAALREVFPNIKINPEAYFISATKGLDPTSFETPIELAKELISEMQGYSVISGPGFAKDIAIGLPAGIVAASSDKSLAKKVAENFSGNHLKVYTSDDVIGVEFGGIFKNVIAIATGIADGMELGDSARAGIITRGLAEMMRLAEAMGAKQKTLAGLSGLGDLVLTATCDASRNRRIGLFLGQGFSLEESKQKVGSTAEGVLATQVIHELGQKHSIDLPITEAVYKLLKSEISLQELPKNLINRSLKDEF